MIQHAFVGLAKEKHVILSLRLVMCAQTQGAGQIKKGSEKGRGIFRDENAVQA